MPSFLSRVSYIIFRCVFTLEFPPNVTFLTKHLDRSLDSGHCSSPPALTNVTGARESPWLRSPCVQLYTASPAQALYICTALGVHQQPASTGCRPLCLSVHLTTASKSTTDQPSRNTIQFFYAPKEYSLKLKEM